MPSEGFIEESMVADVPVCIVRSSNLWIEGSATDQLRAVAGLEGVVGVVGLPDLQPGRGYPVGSVALTKDRLIPILIDKDIGCGMLFTSLGATRVNVAKIVKKLSGRFFSWEGIPVDGAGLRHLLEYPSCWSKVLESLFPDSSLVAGQIIEKACGVKDLPSGATTDLVSDDSLAQSARTMGTIGEGNHFIEIQKVTEITNPTLAEKFCLQDGSFCIIIHTGSRSFGYALAERIFWEAKESETGKAIPPESLLWSRYLISMQVALNFAALNRLVLLLRMLDVIRPDAITVILDKPHNFAEVLDSKDGVRWVIHRKGAVPVHFTDNSFDPVIIPGSMGNESWFCVAGEGVGKTLNSVNHGCGRKWMRGVAAEKLQRKAREKGLRAVTGKGTVVCNNQDNLFEEGGDAYKNVESVMACAEGASLIRRVARLEPVLTVRE